MKVRIPHNPNDDLTYYPGVNHSGDTEMEFDEYIWSIHKHIDWANINTRLHENIISSSGIPSSGSASLIVCKAPKWTLNSGVVYAPYIPLKMTDLKKLSKYI